MTLKVSPLAFVVVAATVIAACSKGKGDPATAKADGAAGTATQGSKGAVNSAIFATNDANIFFVLDAANMGDSAKGALASTKGTSTELRDFARMMVRDHHSMRVQGQALSKRLAIQPIPPTGVSLPARLDSALSRLTAAAKGRDFDKAYIDHEVAAQRELLSVAISAMNMTQNSEIKNLIQNAAPMIQGHLDKAQAIQKNLQK
ncbi:MAG: DUF4142 domain-containing protein [Gemmatimonadaceae bacterium]|nr:DUF4142 domain-containing protein [Gemmatimonadaceae bacterium]